MNVRIFIHSVSMKVTESQFCDLVTPLSELGYAVDSNNHFDHYPCVTTSVGSGGTPIVGFCSYTHELWRDSYYIEGYIPKLFLAIAAMSRGDIVYKGEWLYKLPNHTIPDTPQMMIKEFDDPDEFSMLFWRKANLAELVEYLSVPKPVDCSGDSTPTYLNSWFVRTKVYAGHFTYYKTFNSLLKLYMHGSDSKNIKLEHSAVSYTNGLFKLHTGGREVASLSKANYTELSIVEAIDALQQLAGPAEPVSPNEFEIESDAMADKKPLSKPEVTPWNPICGEKVEAANFGLQWSDYIFIGKDGDNFVCKSPVSEIYKSFTQIRPYVDPLRVTCAQISEKFNCLPHQLIITDYDPE